MTEPKEVICEVECPACGEIVEFIELGFMVCPQCKGARAELTITAWEILEDKEDD